MEKDLIERYKQEMLNLRKKAVATNASPQPPQTEDSTSGGLIVSVTTLRELFPVKNATVTVFTGSGENINELARDLTDESGRTKKFILPTPAKSLSQSAGSSEIPYALYNVTVHSDGFVDYIETDIPVFPDTISLQTADLIPINAAGKNPQPRPFSDFPKFDL